LTVDELTVTLVRWAVDIYHNTPHEGLGGRTPLQQWEADLRAHNVPLHTAPSARRRHIALGVALARVLQKDGIRVMNVRYNSRELAEFFLRNGKRTLEVRWNEEDLGTLEVHFDGAWRTVPSNLDTFKGVHASTWLRTCRSLRATDARRKEWEEHVIALAIRDIEAMNAHAKTTFHILDHAWTEERLKDIESDALMVFGSVPDRPKVVDTPGGRGRTILPVAPPDHAPETPRVAPDRHCLPPETVDAQPSDASDASDTIRETHASAGDAADTVGADNSMSGEGANKSGDESDGFDFDIPT
jgi:putative transposase